MTTTMKSSDTTTATKRSRRANDDEKVNDKLEFLQRKLEATNKSILSALIQHEEEPEQKEENNEMKMLHLLHELPQDTEMKDLMNEMVALDCNDTDTVDVVDEVDETKDKDVSDDADDDTVVVDSSKKIGESALHMLLYRYSIMTCCTYNAQIICSYYFRSGSYQQLLKTNKCKSS